MLMLCEHSTYGNFMLSGFFLKDMCYASVEYTLSLLQS